MNGQFLSELFVLTVDSAAQGQEACGENGKTNLQLVRRASGREGESRQSRCSVARKQLSQSEIVRAAMQSIDQRESGHFSVIDLASAAGVSERTLRKAFLSYFGVAPVKFLKYRTLNQVRKVLENSDSSLTTVTQIATAHGISELGRFATDYRLLFDELPSETLRHDQTLPHTIDAESRTHCVA